MVPYQRRLQMLQLLEQNEYVSLEEFVKQLKNVSESTIRRDLKTMDAEGQIVLHRGGLASLKKGSYEVPFNSKTLSNVSEKDIIARYAASLVKDGESIYLDAGSTVLRMLPYLRERQITVVTTNALIVPELQGSKIECYIVSGEVNARTASIAGTTTNQELMSLYFDKAFLGTSGFSERTGINTPDKKEAEKKKIVRDNSTQTYVLADSSKAGKSTLCKIFELGEVTIICDKELDILKKSGNYLIADLNDKNPE